MKTNNIVSSRKSNNRVAYIIAMAKINRGGMNFFLERQIANRANHWKLDSLKSLWKSRSRSCFEVLGAINVVVKRTSDLNVSLVLFAEEFPRIQ